MKMAASTLSLLFLLAAAATSAAARPCKTIFYTYAAATTTNTYYPHNSLPRNPNFRLQQRDPSYLTLIFTTTPLHNPSSLNFDSINPLSIDSQSSMIKQSDFPIVSSSIRRRIGDILSVVGALLFGIGCGILTGATLYLVWALFFSGNRFDFDSDSYDDDDDVAAAKKLGYVAIPKKPTNEVEVEVV